MKQRCSDEEQGDGREMPAKTCFLLGIEDLMRGLLQNLKLAAMMGPPIDSF
jgi:hypothetical protein